MSEGNGSTNGNGGKPEPTPAQKAWETARQEAREQGRSVRDHEIRAIKMKGLSVWAKLLFWVLSKICWESSAFLYDRRIGSVCITGRQLKTYFGFPQKRLYAQTKKSKDKSGAVASTRRVSGAIQELVEGGFVWMSHKRIENIPANKWPNVFNLMALVPRFVQPGLGLLEGVVVVDGDHATNGGSSDFFAENDRGSGQTPQNGLGKDQRETLPATNGGSGQAPLAGLGKNQRGELPRTNGGSCQEPTGGSCQEPTGVAAHSRQPELPTPASGAPIRLSDSYTDGSDSSKTVNRLRTGTALKIESREKQKGEEQFLESVGRVLGVNELERNGGLWITNYRHDPQRAVAVIAEVCVMKREGRVAASPAKAAVDLWKRWKRPRAALKEAGE